MRCNKGSGAVGVVEGGGEAVACTGLVGAARVILGSLGVNAPLGVGGGAPDVSRRVPEADEGG
jgi:hypothetical protein